MSNHRRTTAGQAVFIRTAFSGFAGIKRKRTVRTHQNRGKSMLRLPPQAMCRRPEGWNAAKREAEAEGNQGRLSRFQEKMSFGTRSEGPRLCSLIKGPSCRSGRPETGRSIIEGAPRACTVAVVVVAFQISKY